jgi:hypothetical protein
MPGTQPPTNTPRLTINITRLIAPQEKRYARNLIRDGATSQGVQLTDFIFSMAGPRRVVHGRRHTGFDQTGTDGVAPDGGAG